MSFIEVVLKLFLWLRAGHAVGYAVARTGPREIMYRKISLQLLTWAVSLPLAI